MKKKKWTHPQLMVLTKRKPEETVLTACKSSSVSVFYTTGVGHCYWPLSCVSCSSFASS